MHLWPFLLAAGLAGWLLYSWYRSVGPTRFTESLLRVGLFAVGVIALLTMFRTTPLLAALLSLLLFVLPALRAFVRARGHLFSGSASDAGHSGSSVETLFFRMHLDHSSGAVDGDIISGRFSGRTLSDLSMDDLLYLRKECENDGQSVAVLDAYLDQQFQGSVDWRALFSQRYNSASRGGSNAAMDRERAYAILGLQPGADADQIRAAHRRLVQRLHPDKGGSDYLVDELNRARDVLLKG